MGDSNLKLILISSTLDCTTFHSFNVKKKKDFQKLAGLWLAGEMIDYIGIYGSKVAEGLLAFQRRSCSAFLLMLFEIYNELTHWSQCFWFLLLHKPVHLYH